MDISSFDFDKLLSHIIPGILLYLPLDRLAAIQGYTQRDFIAISIILLIGVMLIVMFDGFRHAIIDPIIYGHIMKANKLSEKQFYNYQKNNFDLFIFNVQESYRYYEFYANSMFLGLPYCFILPFNIYLNIVFLLIYGSCLSVLSYFAIYSFVSEIKKSINSI